MAGLVDGHSMYSEGSKMEDVLYSEQRKQLTQKCISQTKPIKTFPKLNILPLLSSVTPSQLAKRQIIVHFTSLFHPYLPGALKQGPCTCSTFKSFLVISANVPCTYYVQPLNSLKRYVHVPIFNNTNLPLFTS